MFCSKCGKQIPDGARFCQGCGKPVNTAGQPRPLPQAEQPAGTAQPMPRAAGRPTAPLPVGQPVKCPTCCMLAYPGRGRCLICDTDLGVTVPPEEGCGQEFQQATMPEQTHDQESQQATMPEHTHDQESQQASMPEQTYDQEPQQATMPEHTYNQELVAVSESVQQPVLNERKDK